MSIVNLLAIGDKGLAWFAAGMAIMTGAGTAIAQGLIGMKTVEAAGRQPEATGKLVSLMIIGQVIIETTAIYALIIAFVLIGK